MSYSQPLIGSSAGGSAIAKGIAAAVVGVIVVAVALAVTVGLAASGAMGGDGSGRNGQGAAASAVNTPLVPMPPVLPPNGPTTTTQAAVPPTTQAGAPPTGGAPPTTQAAGPPTTQPGDPGTTGPPLVGTTQVIPPPLPTTPAPPLPAGFNLPPTTAGTLSVVESGTRSSGRPRIVARSYDNGAWEAMRDEDLVPLKVTCRTAASNECVLEGAANPQVRQIDVPAVLQNVDAESQAARLLMQASFGGTKAEVAALAARTNMAEAWIEEQMALPPSLMRAHVRARMNPIRSEITDVANIIDICDVGARYRPVGSGGDGNTLQTIGDNNMDLVPVGSGDHVAISRVSGCDSSKKSGTTAYLLHRGQRYRFVPRVKLLQNTLGEPAGGNAGDMCPAVPKTFVNGFSCLRRASCGAPAARSVELTLNQETLRRWYTGSQRYTYYVTGLRLQAPFAVSPCLGRSRWLKSAGNCPTPSTLTPATTTQLTNALRSSADENPFVRDIELPGANDCTAAPGSSLTVDNVCWTHVHPDLYSVRDFTRWGTGTLHPGNAPGGVPTNPNPIFKWAINGGVELMYPASHPMTRWIEMYLKHIPVIGRWGDSVDYLTLSTELQTADMAQYAGANVAVTGSFESCGSPGEVRNQGTLGHRYIVTDNDLDTNEQRNQLDWVYDFNHGKSMGWLNNAMQAPDQLRQRAAWALQQIFTIGDNGDLYRDEVEAWASYYDIFVRHAFGNYRDMLKEVSFHPLMSDYLTYLGSRSYEQTNRNPDENYAREIMQLFSVGLYKLNADGTNKMENGELIDTYTDIDIVDFARVFTGFDRQSFRSNTEKLDGRERNGVDPLQIRAGNHDKMPKAKLDEGYLGDQYPLCEDLPSQPWRRPGAKWRYTGASSDEGDVMDTHDAGTFRGQYRGRFAPAENSDLYNALCGPRAAGNLCTFPTEVVLSNTIPCDGDECEAQDVVTAMIVRGTQVGYYTYVKQPCVKLSLFNDGRILSYANSHMCGNTKLAIGNPVCCRPTDTDRIDSNENTEKLCHHANERASFNVVKARCEAAGLVICKVRRDRYPNWRNSCADRMAMWVDEPCPLKVQIMPTGRIMVLDNGTVPLFSESNGNQFRVRWENNAFPTTEGAGCGAGCTRVNTASDPTCVCTISETTTPLFSAAMPSAADVLSQARIGAVAPSSYDADAYTLCATPECQADPQLRVWVKAGSNDWKNENTIFEVSLRLLAGDPVKYFMNKLSMISLTGQPALKFRNPPHFMPFLGEWQRRVEPWRSSDMWLPAAHLEVDALMDHLFRHPNTAPFVAYRMIQRMVTSNPSLRYVQSVVNAFMTGRFNGKVYSGRYGDMGATVAAVLLDQEARSPTVEADPRHGALHEPILKLMRFMRTLEYKSKDGREIHMPVLQNQIEQQAFKQPSVFGFYLPEFRPDGPVEDEGLRAPEAQILTTPSIVRYFNGMTSLVNNGLTACDGGFGYNRDRNCRDRNRKRSTADGNLTFSPTGTTPAAIVGELNLLLTAKRLAPETESFMVAEYTKELAADGSAEALRKAMKRIMLTVEFQVNNVHLLTNTVRQVMTAPTGGAGRKYKAIVVVFQGGGADSFNLIVPHSGCGKDYYAEYASVRGGNAIPKANLLEIGVTGQPCSTFGVHPEMSALAQLYNENDAAFFANIGGLVEPLTKAEYQDRRSSKLKPPSPTAHNIAQRTLQNLHAQESNAKGVLGRAVDVLKQTATPYVSEMYSLAGNAKMTQGIITKPDLISSRSGVVGLVDRTFVETGIENVTRYESKSTFGETYASLVGTSLKKTNEIKTLLDNSAVPDFGGGYQETLEMVAKLIKIRGDLGTERAVFFTSRGGWDTHTRFNPPWRSVDEALGKFATEMKAQGVWDDVVVVSVSDFARTMTSNGEGTDHAWGGNHFIAGGGVKGGRFHGKFPDTLRADGDLNVGGDRIRLVPQLGWESMWKGILEWFDVPADKMNEVLPNVHRFPADKILDQAELFN